MLASVSQTYFFLYQLSTQSLPEKVFFAAKVSSTNVTALLVLSFETTLVVKYMKATSINSPALK